MQDPIFVSRKRLGTWSVHLHTMCAVCPELSGPQISSAIFTLMSSSSQQMTSTDVTHALHPSRRVSEYDRTPVGWSPHSRLFRCFAAAVTSSPSWVFNLSLFLILPINPQTCSRVSLLKEAKCPVLHICLNLPAHVAATLHRKPLERAVSRISIPFPPISSYTYYLGIFTPPLACNCLCQVTDELQDASFNVPSLSSSCSVLSTVVDMDGHSSSQEPFCPLNSASPHAGPLLYPSSKQSSLSQLIPKASPLLSLLKGSHLVSSL